MQSRTLRSSDSSAFGALSTALDIVKGVDLRGKTAVVTGASSGIGIETARALASAGAAVTLAVRDVAAGQRAADDIRRSTGMGELSVARLELADLESVEAFARSRTGPLNVLVSNAGIMHVPEQRTRQGWEMHMAVNHLGHFALATALHAALVAAEGARIVSVSSSGHASSGIRFDDMFFNRDTYDSGLAYGQSKTANVLFAVEARRRWSADGVTAAAVMPGGIWTNLQRHWDPAVLADMQRRYTTKTAQQGAATSVYVAVRAELGPDSPVYYEDCHPSAIVERVTDGLHGVVNHALDAATALQLWETSEQLVRPPRR